MPRMSGKNRFSPSDVGASMLQRGAIVTFLVILLLLLLYIIMHGLYYGYHGGLNHAV